MKYTEFFTKVKPFLKDYATKAYVAENSAQHGTGLIPSGSGEYFVSYPARFTGIPTVLVGLNSDSGIFYNINVKNVNETGFYIDLSDNVVNSGGIGYGYIAALDGLPLTTGNSIVYTNGEQQIEGNKTFLGDNSDFPLTISGTGSQTNGNKIRFNANRGADSAQVDSLIRPYLVELTNRIDSSSFGHTLNPSNDFSAGAYLNWKVNDSYTGFAAVDMKRRALLSDGDSSLQNSYYVTGAVSLDWLNKGLSGNWSTEKPTNSEHIVNLDYLTGEYTTGYLEQVDITGVTGVKTTKSNDKLFIELTTQFGTGFIASGNSSYNVLFRESFSSRPSVNITLEDDYSNSFYSHKLSGVGTDGFTLVLSSQVDDASGLYFNYSAGEIY